LGIEIRARDPTWVASDGHHVVTKLFRIDLHATHWVDARRSCAI